MAQGKLRWRLRRPLTQNRLPGDWLFFHSTVGKLASPGGAVDPDLRGTAVACPAAGQCFADISNLSQAGHRDYNDVRDKSSN